uniref:Uncharacterized protein DKFZp686M2365 n=1 Tax=Homo sapiens TaxID=9606 RepID=Q68CU1_HUMAN|nr:hypothetical protein [Homo sapiens]
MGKSESLQSLQR